MEEILLAIRNLTERMRKVEGIQKPHRTLIRADHWPITEYPMVFRTDRNLLYYRDGENWLSVQEYLVQWAWTSFMPESLSAFVWSGFVNQELEIMAQKFNLFAKIDSETQNEENYHRVTLTAMFEGNALQLVDVTTLEFDESGFGSWELNTIFPGHTIFEMCIQKVGDSMVNFASPLISYRLVG